jgi:hypothetical protein
MRAKASADVLLFVIDGGTRGVASVAEAAYYLGCRRSLALVVTDIGPDDLIDGVLLNAPERDDLNRGRIFVRSMALAENVPVFTDVASAVRHAIQLVQGRLAGMSGERLRAILSGVRFGDGAFLAEETAGGFLIQIHRAEMHGRKWFIDATATASDVVRTAFKAASTWAEHEAREEFTYRGARVFSPHFEIDDLVLLASKHDSQ